MDLFDALQAGQGRAALAQLKADPKALGLRSKKGSSVLMGAACFNLPAVARYALDHGADVDERRKDGMTALQFAVEQGHLAVVELLLARGANVELGRAGTSPAAMALDQEHFDVLAVLLEHGARVDVVTAKSPSLLHRLASAGQSALLAHCLARDVEVDLPDREGRTPLMAAVAAGHARVVHLLLELSADVDARAKSGATPLSLALEAEDAPLIAKLIEAGADPKPAVAWLRTCEAPAVRAALVQRGVKVPPARRTTPEAMNARAVKALLTKHGVRPRLAPWWVDGFQGRALVFHGDQHFSKLRLDHTFPLFPKAPLAGAGVIVEGNLVIDGTLHNGEQDFGPFLVVLGDLTVGNVALAGAPLHVEGRLRVKGTFHGYYNHGTTTVQGDAAAGLFLADDYALRFRGKVRGEVVASTGHVKSKERLPRERPLEALLARRYYTPADPEAGEPPMLESGELYDALVAGRSVRRQ